MTTPLEGMAVVFINHHSESLLIPKLPPLVKAGAVVVVVDNSGTFQPSAGVKVVDPGANVGFARGCNLALDRIESACRTVCFHNPDLEAAPQILARLHQQLHFQVRPGLVTPAIRVGHVVRRNGYRYPSPGREIFVGLRAIAAISDTDRVRGAARKQSRRGPVTNSRDVFGRGRRFGSGGLLVASRDALNAVDGFDEDYFLYAEDLDLWHRVHGRGYVTEVASGVVVDHNEATGGRMASADREILRWLGVELFAERTTDGHWLAFRRVHRWLMARLVRHAGVLATPVSEAWDQGARPSEVQRHVRALFAGAR